MKLAAKLILVFLFGVLGIVSLFSWQTIGRQQQWEQSRCESHARVVVEALTPAIAQAYREGRVVTIRQAVEISAQHVQAQQLRWVPPSQRDEKITSRCVSRISVAEHDGSTIVQSYVPLIIDGELWGHVEVSESIATHDDHVRQSLTASLLSLLGVAALSAVVIYWGGVQLVGRPLDKLITQVQRIGDGGFSQPPVLSSKDELGSLALAISQMSHRLDEQRAAIRHADRLGTVGTLAAGVAHEMGTPLNVVTGRAGLIASGKLSEDEIRQSAQTIKVEGERMTVIIRQLLDFARQAPSPHATVDLSEIVTRTCQLMKPLAERASVDIALTLQSPEQPVRIHGDAAQLQQVVTNLINNAIQAMPGGGVVTVSLEPAGGEQEDRTCLRVSDTGVGMNDEQIGRVFEPFYTTKEVGQGTGLGLSIAYGIVREHGGEIQVKSRQGEATSFLVYFPVADEA